MSELKDFVGKTVTARQVEGAKPDFNTGRLWLVTHAYEKFDFGRGRGGVKPAVRLVDKEANQDVIVPEQRFRAWLEVVEPAAVPEEKP